MQKVCFPTGLLGRESLENYDRELVRDPKLVPPRAVGTTSAWYSVMYTYSPRRGFSKGVSQSVIFSTTLLA